MVTKTRTFSLSLFYATVAVGYFLHARTQVVHKKKTKTRELLTNKLQKHPLFEALGAKELSELVDAMQSVSVAPKENLISRGAAMNEMYILEVGELTGA